MRYCQPEIINFIDHVDPFIVAKYLEITGWKRFPRKQTDIPVYQFPICNDDFYQVTVPMDKALGDYREALSEAIRTIAEVEGKIESELVQLFLHPHSDILHVKIKSNNVFGEGFSLRNVESFYETCERRYIKSFETGIS